MTNNVKINPADKREISALLYKHRKKIENNFAGRDIDDNFYNEMLHQLYGDKLEDIKDDENFINNRRNALEALFDENNYSLSDLYADHVNSEAAFSSVKPYIDNVEEYRNNLGNRATVLGSVGKVCTNIKEGIIGASQEFFSTWLGFKFKTPTEKATTKAELLNNNVSNLGHAIDEYDPKNPKKGLRENINDLIEDVGSSANILGRMGKKEKYATDGIAKDTIKDSLSSNREKLNEIKNKMEDKGLKEEAEKLEEIKKSIAEMIRLMITSIRNLFCRITGIGISQARNQPKAA